jgi:hypothetical protein
MRRIASGADLYPERRFAADLRLSAEPLLVVDALAEARVFAGSNLGAGALLDVLNGEPCWTVKNRRREPRASGWLASPPRRARPPPAEPHVLWAPPDSDRLYALRGRPLAAGEAETGDLFAAAPGAKAEAERCLGGAPGQAIVLGGSGGARTISARRNGADRVDALGLSAAETFRNALVSSTRVWISTDRGVYLLDRERELYALDHERLPALGRSSGGDMLGHGPFVLVAGAEALWSLRVE